MSGLTSELGQTVTVSEPVDYLSKFPTLTFINRNSFNTLQGHKFSFVDFPKVVNNYYDHPGVSKMTQAYLRHVNNEMYRILFGNDFESWQEKKWDDFTDAETKSLHEQFLELMLIDSPAEGGALFEILPVDGENYLVIMENGFLHHVTSTKGNLEEFVLTCLRHQHQFKSDKSLLIEMYLNLRLIPAYHTLMRLRVR